jgi:hypothetical protein
VPQYSSHFFRFVVQIIEMTSIRLGARVIPKGRQSIHILSALSLFIWHPPPHCDFDYLSFGHRYVDQNQGSHPFEASPHPEGSDILSLSWARGRHGNDGGYRPKGGVGLATIQTIGSVVIPKARPTFR